MSQPEMKVNSDGSKYWFLNGDYHREDGPAIEVSDGSKYWFLYGERHREDGPAVELIDGSKFWYLNNVKVTWKEVFCQAKNPEIELRILITAFTNG
jgi:hypothetical protein